VLEPWCIEHGIVSVMERVVVQFESKNGFTVYLRGKTIFLSYTHVAILALLAVIVAASAWVIRKSI
jgi:hypothetical protein